MTPNSNEKHFRHDELLVTKTNLKGIITYANKSFINIVGMDEEELIGAPHNIIRHPDMPKVIFKFLWSYLQNKEEIHAYVKNLCADGSYYWVMANVTPSFLHGKVVGYHSSRRTPTKEALEAIVPLYKKLLDAEKSGGVLASEKMLSDILKEKGMNYDEFILSI
ncbi:MAG: PAS domain S-box protein [Epsilonproteobacteria bacterium]|nr:PAS domain S-box protein [Campylobacterota bacterium]OIO16945.1 MAG: PAS sensor protein [Helicobacteraceae bacterium CG1_02_36_14]PIP10947.1 MAG: PAS sensor protein [Sulfurimonas sp. CG23_combo_of_CG06-09_8_20_14_all_36_33]PIS24686.1 MAG: PAS sensor protein [Sulfurimonas sp. CG08_land_8_20_14_0_20_36_33]PIU34114.1 MAG: PAS sensor protein [Sulfurimonas sp. CG07_land_8_20_14_0_80_36_56]PIV03539.1 MAG: PAS sensor protein [Sulfurimonas sp. CG03_land_8_20_14_0_80_36_25]PIV35022.1 MAG: PAS senso